MKIRLLILALILLALLPLRQQAFAKCAFAKYTITGIVRDESTNQAIPNTTLFFFFDDYKSTLSEGYKTKYPDFFTTDREGNFVATAFFDTYSGGGLFGDRCNRKPKKLTVIITASGYLTKRVIFNTNDLNIGGRALEYTIELLPLLLYQSKY